MRSISNDLLMREIEPFYSSIIFLKSPAIFALVYLASS
jgi:hypothetical protein